MTDNTSTSNITPNIIVQHAHDTDIVTEYHPGHDYSWFWDTAYPMHAISDIPVPEPDLAVASLDHAAKCDLLVTTGTNHSLTAKVLTGMESRPALLVFDSHLDVDRSERTDHGWSPPRSWLRDVVRDNVVQGTVEVLGTRGWGPSQQDWAWAIKRKISARGYESLPSVLHALGKTAPVYLSIDLSVCDPAYAPGVRWPEPGGWTPAELLTAVTTVVERTHLVGLDITELCPGLDPHGLTGLLADRLLRHVVTGWWACQA